MLINTNHHHLKCYLRTGSGSGATANVQSYDNQRQILKYTNLLVMFIDNEKSQHMQLVIFKILKNDNYTQEGKVFRQN